MIKRYYIRLLNSGNLHSLLANFSYSVFGFIIFLVLTRNLSHADFGTWILFITTTSLLDMFRVGLTGTATIRMLSSHSKYKDREIISTSYRLTLVNSLSIGAAFFVLFLILSFFSPSSYYHF